VARSKTPVTDFPRPGPVIQLQTLSDAEMRATHRAVIQRRGPPANSPQPSPAATFTMLDRATAASGGFLDPPGTQLNISHLIIHEVEGLPPSLRFMRRACESLKQGFPADPATRPGAGAAADAAVGIFFLADLRPFCSAFATGLSPPCNRSGIFAASSISRRTPAFGATGLTFFDDDVTRSFLPTRRQAPSSRASAQANTNQRSSRNSLCEKSASLDFVEM